ncbi:MAG: UDP-N-acetylmuramoyl-tripeptide--D-alanyl-D-alanine ligase [Flavobacteriales bacterium]|nr:UDP-N-acetylmuramoyl-tripeptide--D-alanyl-D-alanine ligase [Flavobacteriales bacterium]MBP9079973.1 UDP-N-acetylmuramoyl-tripeptide--D-alanyl-D-alanine ligase [Flavobacteriales bacterium]
MASIEQLHQVFQLSAGICTDTRKPLPGGLFFALSGPNFNANAFAAQALAKGCAYAVVDDPAVATDERFTVVPDTLKALQDLAREHRRSFDIPVIGITGTNGKTTTKELLHAVLETDKSTLATEGNLNNHIGVPLTLLKLKPEHRIAIIEMGASKRGDIAELCAIAEPTHGLITNIGKAHLEGFGSVEGVVATKTELYAWLREHQGTAFVNGDDPLLMEKSEGIAKRITYGTGEQNRVQGDFIDGPAPYLNFYFSVPSPAGVPTVPGFPNGWHCETRLVGTYNLPNALAAVAVGKYFGVPDDFITDAICSYEPANSRSQFKDTGRNQLILDAYNANPTSMAAALTNFEHLKSDRSKLAILGDMLELGAVSQAEHKGIIELCKKLGLEAIYVGSEFAQAATGADVRSYPAAADALKALQADAPTGRLILVKGSRGVKLEEVVTVL